MPSGEPMRPWTEAMADYAPFLRHAASSPVARLRPGATRDRPRAPVVLAVRRPLRRGRPPRRRAWMRSASCGGQVRSTRRGHPRRARAASTGRASSRPICRARRPASCVACTTTGGSSTAGSWHRVGRSSRSSTSVRPPPATGPAVVETANARGRRLGRDPGRGGPWLPGARAARAGLLRHGGVRRQRRARLRLGRPGGRRAVAAADRARPPTAGPILSERDRSNPTLAELVARLRG